MREIRTAVRLVGTRVSARFSLIAPSRFDSRAKAPPWQSLPHRHFFRLVSQQTSFAPIALHEGDSNCSSTGGHARQRAVFINRAFARSHSRAKAPPWQSLPHRHFFRLVSQQTSFAPIALHEGDSN